MQTSIDTVSTVLTYDGYIIVVVGPYATNKPDAVIMLEVLLEDGEVLFHWFYRLIRAKL